jgi:hypothetical protein
MFPSMKHEESLKMIPQNLSISYVENLTSLQIVLKSHYSYLFKRGTVDLVCGR